MNIIFNNNPIIEIEEKIFSYLEPPYFFILKFVCVRFYKQFHNYYFTNIYKKFLLLNKNFNILDWVQNLNWKINELDLYSAIIRKSFSTVKWMTKYFNPKDIPCFWSNENEFKWLLIKGFQWDKRCGNMIAEEGNLNLIKWIKGKKLKLSKKINNFFALSSKIELIKWGIDNGFELFNKTLYNSALTGNLEFFKKIFDYNKIKLGISGINGGNIQILEFLINIGIEFDTYMFDYSIRNRNIEMVKFLHANKCPFYTISYRHAIYHNDLEMIKFLMENGYQNDEFLYAVERGNLTIIKYLIDKNIKHQKIVFIECLYKTDLTMTIWLYNNGCKYNGKRLISDLINAKCIDYIDWFEQKEKKYYKRKKLM